MYVIRSRPFQMHESPYRSAGLGMKASQACVSRRQLAARGRVVNWLITVITNLGYPKAIVALPCGEYRRSRARDRRHSEFIRNLGRLLDVHASSQQQRNTDACRNASAQQFDRAVEAIQPPLRTMCDSRDSRVNRSWSISYCLLLHGSTEPMRNRSGHERWQPASGKWSFVGIAATSA